MRPFRFAIISDPHIALPHTIRQIPNRFHLVEVSIPVFEAILADLAEADLDFLLLPGDLTQHGERENHEWLVNRLRQLPFPVYVVPGNHDVLTRAGGDAQRPVGAPCPLSLKEFPHLYRDFGYDGSDLPYYRQEILPGLHLIGLNSIAFDQEGNQIPYGYLTAPQRHWLEGNLRDCADQWVMVMIHHNVLEHLPGQSRHPLGQRYILRNRKALLKHLQSSPVALLLTGHLHVQDVVQREGLWEVTTGSLVSYPHPYRILTATPTATGQLEIQIETHRILSVADWPDLQAASLDWMRDRAFGFMVRLLTCPPFSLSLAEAEQYAPHLQDFWARISAGDGDLTYPQLPSPLQEQLRTFGAVDDAGNYCAIDNATTLMLSHGRR
ncbi:metallophosphoesterase family protein [Leptolyngbya sp. PCC 6406]|uniref:metallophosphoesterase family protein n=1 Tax=Leptolyngbya sp. PCC 6406 TaxID=1173264 RepID=UPI0002EE84FA|nr:metallophosphoesterase [Leptolyngbya sp. PCC 6406]